MPKLKREVSFDPQAGRMRVCFRVRGKEGVVQFVWLVRTEGEKRDRFREVSDVPEGRGLDFHAKKPRSYQNAVDRYDCDVLEQGYCYCDGSLLMAEELGEKFAREGEAVVWNQLDELYVDWLEKDGE